MRELRSAGEDGPAALKRFGRIDIRSLRSARWDGGSGRSGERRRVREHVPGAVVPHRATLQPEERSIPTLRLDQVGLSATVPERAGDVAGFQQHSPVRHPSTFRRRFHAHALVLDRFRMQQEKSRKKRRMTESFPSPSRSLDRYHSLSRLRESNVWNHRLGIKPVTTAAGSRAIPFVLGKMKIRSFLEACSTAIVRPGNWQKRQRPAGGQGRMIVSGR